MITDKQKQKDYEYDGEYQSKSRYTIEQWTNILKSDQLEEADLTLLKQIYASYNHAASLLQLSFHNTVPEESILEQINAIGETLAAPNNLNPEVDFSGQEYWWYLCFWGKNTSENSLELKLHPELSEAIGTLFPELEQAYYAFMNDIERSLQIRYTQEDAVWIAAACLLYEKYYRYPGISADDILLMQYEVQTRAQKVYGQDVNANTITQICNADERGHRYNYLRDIYKYYRVTFPGEFEMDRERPDPETIDYGAYTYSIFGYVTIHQLVDFIEHEYAHLVDESYIELTNANGFVHLADYLTRQGGSTYREEDNSEQTISLMVDGEDVTQTFHLLAEALLKEYPNFTYAKKANWLLPDTGLIAGKMQDLLYIEDYASTGASIGISTISEGDAVHIEVSLNLPFTSNEETMLDIQDKCNMLTLMTTAPFQVKTMPCEPFDLVAENNKIKAFVLYSYEEFKTMTQENIVGLFTTSLEIFASYYTDICQNYYPAAPQMEETEDPFAAALGSKLVYRQGADVPGPQIVYKQTSASPTTTFIEQALQNYGSPKENNAEMEEEQEKKTAPQHTIEEITETIEAHTETSSGPIKSSLPPARNETIAAASSPMSVSPAGTNTAPPVFSGFSPEEKVSVSTHPYRSEQGFRLYPKNTLIQGPVKTGKYHEAIMLAVGIIEGKDPNMMSIEPVPEVLSHYKDYVEEKRILHISYPDIHGDGYEGWIEARDTLQVRDGIFKEFANRCGEGRYVVMMEEVDLNWMHLFGETSVLLRENRREGTSSETAVTLKYSKEMFRLPSNLYIVATCDSIVCEDTILGAIHHDFFIRHISPDAYILHGMRIEGILLERLMTTLNLRISYFLGATYQLGEGFFLESPDKDPFISLCRVFREQMIPLLEKWFDGDIERIRYVLGDNGKTRADTIFYQEMPYREGLFKGTIDDSFDTGRSIYQINEDAFYNPKSYIDIYEN